MYQNRRDTRYKGSKTIYYHNEGNYALREREIWSFQYSQLTTGSSFPPATRRQRQTSPSHRGAPPSSHMRALHFREFTLVVAHEVDQDPIISGHLVLENERLQVFSDPATADAAVGDETALTERAGVSKFVEFMVGLHLTHSPPPLPLH